MLSKMQHEFVVHYTSHPDAVGNASKAAKMAGYSPKSAKELGYKLVHKPHVKKAIDKRLRRQVDVSAAYVATQTLLDICQSDKAHDRVKVAAAKELLKRWHDHQDEIDANHAENNITVAQLDQLIAHLC